MLLYNHAYFFSIYHKYANINLYEYQFLMPINSIFLIYKITFKQSYSPSFLSPNIYNNIPFIELVSALLGNLFKILFDN